MPRSVRRNLVLNFNQLALNQLFGFILFLVLSRTLAKVEFGALNWALSVLLLAFSILNFGLDQLLVKKIASGETLASVLSCFLIHLVVTGLSFWIVTLLFVIFFHPPLAIQLVCYLGIGKLFLSLSTPFKQAANGLEYFKELGQMSVISSACKAVIISALFLFKAVSLSNIIAVFVIGDLAEFLFSVYKAGRILPDRLKWRFEFSYYRKLLGEALPQLGVVILAATIARFDWIYIGWIGSPGQLAEYSFAYRLFELSSLPLLVIAPLLVPLFSRINRKMVKANQTDLQFIFRIQMILACLTMLLLTICWTPVIDPLTDGKYGSVNHDTIFVLSLCLPFLYLNNFIWSYHFAQGHLRLIFKAFLISFLINALTVPLFHHWLSNEGVAISYLATIIGQSLYYTRRTDSMPTRHLWRPVIISLAFACTGYFLVQNLFNQLWIMISFALIFYVTGLLATMQLMRADWLRLKKVLAW